MILQIVPTLCMQNENKRFPLLERYIASSRILDSVADQDLTKDPSSIANVVLHFPHPVPEE